MKGQKDKRIMIECMFGSLVELCDLQGRESHERKAMVHFDNTPIVSTEEFKSIWPMSGSKEEEWSIFPILRI
jgi:hypothetical protein